MERSTKAQFMANPRRMKRLLAAYVEGKAAGTPSLFAKLDKRFRLKRTSFLQGLESYVLLVAAGAFKCGKSQVS